MKYLEHNGHSNKKRYKLCMLLIMCITMTYIAAGCGSKRDGLTITNVSYDPTREFYEEYNKVFADYYMAEYGKQIKVIQSHGGSGSQARSVVEGCNADVVTLALEHDISLIENTGLIDAGWKDEYDKDSSPYTSTIVFLVRKGNPLNISDWDDLIKDGVEVITPDPKSSGGACWNFLAALSYARDKNNSEDKQKEFLGKLYANVSVLDSGARGSTTTFVENKKGDVLIAWENEALTSLASYPDEYEIVTPSVSILAQPSVAVVDDNVKVNKTEELASEYLSFLYSKQAQRIAADYGYRPTDEEVLKLSKYGKLQQYNSAAEEGYVEDILFRGNHLDVTVNIGGTMITGEWSLEKEPLQVGEKVHVLIYRIYAVDDEKTYLCENKGMRDDDVFYI